jgi:hypothetical protein
MPLPNSGLSGPLLSASALRFALMPMGVKLPPLLLCVPSTFVAVKR